MRSFSFIHAADLHLGSPFKGVGSSSPAAAEQLRSATFDAFGELIDLCLEKSVDFLLVAGDVFDLSGRNLRAQLTFRDGLSQLSDAGIRSFVVNGNHDPRETWSRRISWPKGTHIFSHDKVEAITISVDETPVAAISGISYRNQRETRNLASLFRAEQPDLYQIALLHSNCGNNPDHGVYAPCSVDVLRKSGFDYWALGHVHEKKILDTVPHIVYPGCTQGLSIRETGEHGCWLVSVTANRQAALIFHPLDKLRWQTADISIADIESLDELDRSIASTLEQIHESAGQRPGICRIRLAGRGPLYPLLRNKEITEELLDRTRQLGEQLSLPVWVQRLDILCQPDMDLSQRRESDDLLGEILRNVSRLRVDAKTLSDRLMPVLKDMYDNPRLRRHLTTLSATDLDRLLQGAATLCYDLLELEE